MKKIASIFFLSTLLFNWFGFRILTNFLEDNANAFLIESLDKDIYDEAELVTIKLPANLPYYSGTNHFDRIDGEIEINGIQYNFVKCRLYNDSVEYLCIPNQARTTLSNAKDEFYKLVNDLQHPSQSKKNNSTHSFKNPLSEFYQETATYNFAACLTGKKTTNAYLLPGISEPLLPPREIPPDSYWF